MDNPGKLVTWDTQDEDKQNKTILIVIDFILDSHHFEPLKIHLGAPTQK